MTYESPTGNATGLSFEGVYIPRYGGNVILGNTSYIARWGGDLYLVSEGEYTPFNGGLLKFEFGETPKTPEVLEPPTIEDGLPKMRPDFAVVWGDGETKEHGYRLQYKDAKALTTHKNIKWVKEKGSNDTEVIIPWGGLTENEKRLRLKYSRFVDLLDLSFDSPFTATPEQKDNVRRVPYGVPDVKDESPKIPFRSPPKKDDNNRILFTDSTKTADAEKEIPFNQGTKTDGHHNTKWGKRFFKEICTRDYKTPGGGNLDFNLKTPIEDVDESLLLRFYFDALTYDLRCKHDEPTGYRDKYDFVKPKYYPHAPYSKSYTIMNNLLLTRVSDRKPIDVKSVTISSNLGSWCWTLSAGILSQESYEAIEPDENGNQEVEVELNGYKWRFLVEQATDNKSFARPSWSISGRGLAAGLADPYAKKTSYTETAARTALQLIEERLENTGWTVDFRGVDWLIPGGAYSYHDLSPLKAIQQITEAAGAVLQSEPLEKKLIVFPRYKTSPWNWASITPDLSINDTVTTQAAMTWKPGPGYNGVFVSGTNAGVLAKVSREGTSGTDLAPMSTNALITATEVAREKGRNVLAAAGNWQTGGLTMPLFPSPGVPGLILPGSLLEAPRRNTTFKSQVTGNNITANRQGGLVVRQHLEVERYRGN